MDQRKIEVNKNGEWISIPFGELKSGDIFRMFENTGEPVIGDKDDTVFTAISNPYKINETLSIDIK
jgi:hypothetical protein